MGGSSVIHSRIFLSIGSEGGFVTLTLSYECLLLFPQLVASFFNTLVLFKVGIKKVYRKRGKRRHSNTSTCINIFLGPSQLGGGW
jgi:hypothetical protein